MCRARPASARRPARRGVGRVGAGVLVVSRQAQSQSSACSASGQLLAHGFAHGVDALRVHHVQLLGDVGLRGQGQHQLLEGRVQLRVAQHGAQGLHKAAGQEFRSIGL